MSYLQESTIPNQMLQQRETTDVKEDQGIQQGILGNYDHVDQSQVFANTCLSDQAESGKKNSYLAAKKWTVKCEKTGETHDKLVSKPASLKMRRDRTVGKNERHNKVCTSRGLRDRRVRLSAHTAIKFYDVQDRLGYDQPSKAIDWLIEKAKQAIKAVAHELPGQNHDSVDSDIGYIVQQKMKQVLREQSLCNPQCSSYGDLEFQKCDMNVTNMDNEVTFSMPSRFQDCPADQNSTNGRLLCFQSYEDPFGFEFQHSSRIGFTEQALNYSSNLPPNSNPTDPSCLQSPMASDPLLPLVLEQPLLVHRESQFLSQRGTLQSSHLLSLLASTNPPICAHGNAHYAQAPNSNLLSTKRFSSGGFFGFKQDEDHVEEN